MSSVMRPVGPQPPNVYWRRRIVVLIVLAAVLALLIWVVTALVGALGGEDPEPTTVPPATDSSGSSSPATPDPSGTDATAASDCTEDQIRLVATSSSRTHTVGSTATVGMTITNTSRQACLMDVGSQALTILVKSGGDDIWSSDDCEVDARSDVVTVAPGDSLESSVPWRTERSATGCQSGLSPIRPGTYQVIAKAGGFTSAPLTVTVRAGDEQPTQREPTAQESDAQ